MSAHKLQFVSGLPGPENEFRRHGGDLKQTISELVKSAKEKADKRKARERLQGDPNEQQLRGNYYRSPEDVAAYGKRAKQQFPDN